MSKCKESEAVVAICSPKKVLSKIPQITQGSTYSEASFDKTASPQVRSSIKKRLQHRRPPSPPSPLPPSPHRETRKTSKNNSLYRTPPMMAASGERQNMI